MLLLSSQVSPTRRLLLRAAQNLLRSHCNQGSDGPASCLGGNATGSHAAARYIHSSQEQASPQYGGYLSTGTAAGAAGEQGPNTHRILVTGACGQIGAELVPFLRSKLGVESVIASDVKTNPGMIREGPFLYLDVQDKDNLTRVALENGVTHICHLATLLSAVGERNPQLALRVNTAGIQNVLDIAANHGLKVYSPSTIAVFGSTSPKVMTPDDTVTQPNTMYGVTKVHQELLGKYYRDRFGVDYRSLRYPGIISAKTPPGGGTTDYAVEIFHSALKTRRYTCFLSKDASLPMMYMPDCLEATWQLMSAPAEKLTRCTYNVTAVSFSPEQLAQAIQKVIPDFQVTYTPDFRDAIAKTWPDSIDDSAARRDWGWQHRYGLEDMVTSMVEDLTAAFERKKAEEELRRKKEEEEATRSRPKPDFK